MGAAGMKATAKALAGVIFAAALAACGADPGYSVHLRAEDGREIVLISAPDGKRGAAQIDGAEQALMDPAAAEAALAAEALPAADLSEPDVSMKAPGFSLKVEEGADGAEGVELKIGGLDVSVNEQHERAEIRLQGLDADAARNFIDDLESLNADNKAALKSAVGL